MFQKFQKHLSENFPELMGKSVLLAISGGIDSCVLLNLCLRAGLKPALAHSNFQLRGDTSDQDAGWIKNLAQVHDLRCHIKTFETEAYAEENKISIQMAARELRYCWFSELSEDYGYDHILVGHHGDDSLETFMINSMRGSGLKGLLGIPEEIGKILRPLLPFNRNEIQKYANENSIQWREDSSNAKTDYLRNALRHEVIPLWKKQGRSFDENFKKTLYYLGLAQDLLDNLVVDFKRKNFIPSANGIKITNSSLLELKALDYYLHSLFAPYGFNNITDLHQLMQAQSGKQLFSKTHRLVKDRDCFLLTENISKDDKTHVINADFNKIDHPIPLIFSNEKTVLDKGPKKLFLDKSKLKFPLYIRKWKQSDYFYPYGMDGKKKLSKYFKDEKFSLLEKESQWLLCSSDDVVWVIGKRADARFLADAKSDNIWLIQLND